MPEHYTKNTLEATVWCNKCNRMTQHRVDGGRRGPCLEHEAPMYNRKQEKEMKKKTQQSGNLFEAPPSVSSQSRTETTPPFAGGRED